MTNPKILKTKTFVSAGVVIKIKVVCYFLKHLFKSGKKVRKFGGSLVVVLPKSAQVS